MPRREYLVPLCTFIVLFCSFLFTSVSLSAEAEQASGSSCKVLKNPDGLRQLIPDCWYQKAAGLKVVTFKKNLRYGHELSLDPTILSGQLDEIKAQGFSAIEIFAPADGVKAYNGLDQKNYYRIDPDLGTMDDFRQAIRLTHSKGLTQGSGRHYLYQLGLLQRRGSRLDSGHEGQEERCREREDQVVSLGRQARRAPAGNPGR